MLKGDIEGQLGIDLQGAIPGQGFVQRRHTLPSIEFSVGTAREVGGAGADGSRAGRRAVGRQHSTPLGTIAVAAILNNAASLKVPSGPR